MECMKEKNLDYCNCTASCSRHGVCCECVKHHAGGGQFPACFFSTEGEALHNRSFETLLKDRGIK